MAQRCCSSSTPDMNTKPNHSHHSAKLLRLNNDNAVTLHFDASLMCSIHYESKGASE